METSAELANRDAPDGPRARRKCILTVLPGGGYTFETSCLLRSFGGDFDFCFLRTRCGGVPGHGGLPPGEAFEIRSFSTFTHRSRIESLRACIDAFLVTIRVLRNRRIDLVLVVGAPQAAPMLLAARLMGVRTAFVESITRTDRLSATGAIVLQLRLASRLFVQWPRLKEAYPDARVGTIL